MPAPPDASDAIHSNFAILQNIRNASFHASVRSLSVVLSLPLNFFLKTLGRASIKKSVGVIVIVLSELLILIFIYFF